MPIAPFDQINPSIPLQVRGPSPIVNPLEVMQGIQSMRAQREQTAALAEQRRALAEQHRARTAQMQADAQREADGSAAFDEFAAAFQPGKPLPAGPIGKLYRAWGPERATSAVKLFGDLNRPEFKSAEEAHESMVNRISWLADVPEDRRAAGFNAVVQDFVRRGVFAAEEAPQYSPELFQTYVEQVKQAKKKAPIAVSPNGMMDPTTNQIVVPPAPPKPPTLPASAQEYEYAKSQGFAGSFEQWQTAEANRRKPVVNVNGMGGMYAATDPKAIADGIASGAMPPMITEYGRAVQGAVATELQKRGFNLAMAVTDWKATQKHVQTMNGAQQLRLNQSINALPELLDSVDTLASQWKANAHLPILNKANLLAAKSGAYGKDAAIVANQLETQIADVVGDLGTVYMGGNSPTDHAMKLAETALKGEWDEKVIHSMVKLAKQNVIIRRNSITNTGVAGASAGNTYAPPAPTAAPSAPQVEEWVRDPKTGRMVKKGGG